MPEKPNQNPIACAGNGDPSSRLSTPIPDSTKRRRLRIQHAARLYIYEGVDAIPDLSKKSGVGAKYLRRIKIEDDWDGFAEKVWSERTTSTLTIRTVEEQSLIDGEKERQHREVPKLQKEAERLMDALAVADPGSKVHAAILTAMKTVRGLLEGSTHYDLAKTEAAARMKLSLTTQPTAPAQHQPGTSTPMIEPGDALDLNEWEGDEQALPAQAVDGDEGDAEGRNLNPQTLVDRGERERGQEPAARGSLQGQSTQGAAPPERPGQQHDVARVGDAATV